VRRCVLGNLAGPDPITCLLAAAPREWGKWNKPLRQDGEGLPAWAADPTPDPKTLAPVIVRLSKSAAVAENRRVMAERTQPRQ